MKKLYWRLFISLCFLLKMPTIFAQKASFTDHKPQYKPWVNTYILDKITYTQAHTIFFFRFVSANGGDAIFYAKNEEYPWVLVSKESKETFPLIEIRNVKQNGILEAATVEGTFYCHGRENKNNVFTCEIYFPRLPNHVKTVDLIEGLGNENNQRHFNCFRIKLKTQDDKNLGTEEDSKKTAENFNKEFKIKEETTIPTPPPITHNQPPTPRIDQPLPDQDNPYPIPRLRHKADMQCGYTIVLDKIKFRDDSDEFMAQVEANRQMLILLDYMTQNSNAIITIYGHTDIFGDAEKNLILSKKRAQKIQFWLSMNGISNKRIKAEWFGTTKPLYTQGDSKNRRVEFKLDCF